VGKTTFKKSWAKSVATESVATESVATESVATESVATESVATESVATESVVTDYERLIRRGAENLGSLLNTFIVNFQSHNSVILWDNIHNALGFLSIQWLRATFLLPSFLSRQLSFEFK
jgi:hypothetical protein